MELMFVHVARMESSVYQHVETVEEKPAVEQIIMDLDENLDSDEDENSIINDFKKNSFKG